MIDAKNVAGRAWSPGLVVMGDDSRGRGSNPGTVYWIDMTFFSVICFKNCTVCFRRP